MTLKECYAKCDELGQCDGVTTTSASSHASPTSDKVKCFRRGRIRITDCEQQTVYDTWVRKGAPIPAAVKNLTHSVSGFSSGGSIAVLHFVAFSGTAKGVGVIAGSPYGCQILPDYAYTCSMPRNTSGPTPWADYLDKTYKYMKDRADHGLIDPIENMVGRPVYLFSGGRDNIVARQVMLAVDTQMRNLTSSSSVLGVYDIAAEHSFVVDDHTCAQPLKTSASPFCGVKPGPAPDHGGAMPNGVGCCADCESGWYGAKWWRPPINNCKYDMAGKMLQHIYGTLVHRSASKPTNLVPIDQALYIPEGASIGEMHMDPVAWLYIPSGCQPTDRFGEDFKCRIHVHYHCCQCSWRVLNMGTSYVAQTGLNEWAESNNIVVVYPQAADYPDNDDGCWDWDGSYVGPNFDTQGGLQLKTVQNIVNHVPAIAADFRQRSLVTEVAAQLI